MSIVLWAQEAVLLMLGLYWTVWDRYMQVLYLGRALRTKETVTPQIPGVRWLPVNPRNTSGCWFTRRHFRKSGRVSFVRRALPKYSTCIYLSQTVQYNPNMSKTASWAHNTILITIVSRVNKLLLYNIY